MKVLLDTCVWGRAKAELVALGHDVIWSGEWPEDPGDDEILARAHREGRVLVTLDKDFGELAVVRKQPHSGIVRAQVNSACGRRQEPSRKTVASFHVATVWKRRSRVTPRPHAAG